MSKRKSVNMILEQLEDRRLLAAVESLQLMGPTERELPSVCSAFVSMPMVDATGSLSVMPSHVDAFFRANQAWTRDLAAGEPNDENVVTVSMVPDNTPVIGGADATSDRSNLFLTLDRLFGNTESWQTRIREAVETWDKLTGLRFVFVTDDGASVPDSKGLAGSRGQIRFAGLPLSSSEDVLGYATSKLGNEYGDIVINTNISDANSFLPNLSAIVLHEFGHILDLKHTWPVTQTKIMENRLIRGVLGPQTDDILEAQRLHGDDYEPNGSIVTSTSLGKLPIGTTTVENVSIQNNRDIDLFRFEGEASQKVSMRLVPEGSIYPKAYEENQGNMYPEFDSLRQSNLRLELLDALGQVLAERDLKLVGETETIEDFPLTADGDFYLRIQGSGIDTQRYKLIITIAFATPADELPSGDTAWLRQRVAEANSMVNPPPIPVPAGIYRLDSPIRISGKVVLVGSGIDRTIFDGGGTSQLFVADNAVSLSVSQATLRNSRSQGNGGAINFFGTDLTLDTISLRDNRAEMGGAVYVYGGDVTMRRIAGSFNESIGMGGVAFFLASDARIEASNFTFNKAASGGAVTSLGNVKIQGSYFFGNEAPGGGAISFGRDQDSRFELSDSWLIGNLGAYGGALSLGNGVSTISRVQISENKATSTAGGIRIVTDNSPSGGGAKAIVTIDRSLIDKNEAGSAGGIHSNENSDVTIRRSWIRQNKAISTAGGIGTSGRFRIEESTVSENTARDWFGGGVAVTEGGELLAINSTFSSNVASSYGSGLATFAGGTIDLLNSTVVDNSLDTNLGHGAGIHLQSGGRATLANSIIANNYNGRGKVDIVGDISVSTSLIGAIDPSTARILGGPSNLIGDVSAPLDPKLGPLADNGGPTPTHRLFANSPALNAGLSVQGLVDQRGNLRTDGRVDIGAFEDATIPVFTNHPPTIELATSVPIQVSSGTGGTASFRNVTDGDGNRQSLILRASSSNMAVVPSVSLSSIQADQTVSLQYSIAPGTSGNSMISVEVTDAGADSQIGTSDDLSRTISFEIQVSGPTTGVPLLSISDAIVMEPRVGEDTLKYQLHLSRPSIEPVTARVSTVGMMGSPNATLGADYVGNEQLITFFPGQTVRTFEVRVKSDTDFEVTEIVTLKLDQVVGATSIREHAVGYIVDNPGTFGNPLLPPIRPQPVTSTGIFVSVHSTGPTVVPPSPPVKPPTPPVQKLLADTFRYADVDRDGSIAPLDVLIVINYVNRYGSTRGSLDTSWRLDVDLDNFIGPLDVLVLINLINEKT